MGQGQMDLALEYLKTCAQEGSWLCLTNLHLVTGWLPRLVKVHPEQLESTSAQCPPLTFGVVRRPCVESGPQVETRYVAKVGVQGRRMSRFLRSKQDVLGRQKVGAKARVGIVVASQLLAAVACVNFKLESQRKGRLPHLPVPVAPPGFSDAVNAPGIALFQAR